MGKYYEIDGMIPVVDPTAYVHPDAVLIGDAIVGPGCYVGPCAVMRGDFGRVELKEGANLQDNCLMHSFPNQTCLVGRDGHVGHGAILHGCELKDNVLVGMNAVVMDGTVLGENTIVAACAFVAANMNIPANSLVAGLPGKVIRTLSQDEINWKISGTDEYKTLAIRSRNSLKPVTPLSEVEENRPMYQGSDAKPLQETREK